MNLNKNGFFYKMGLKEQIDTGEKCRRNKMACLLHEYPSETKNMDIMTVSIVHVEKKFRSVEIQMSNNIPIRFEDTNIEVLARIVKAASRKFDCSMKIDFSNGNRKVEFVGDDFYKPLIVEEIEEIFSKDGG